MVYSTDRSKAVVPVLVFTLCCFVVYSTKRFVVCLSMCHFVLVFFSPFSIAITSLGEERANLSAFRTFVRFVLVWICRFPLPLGVWEGLRFVIVALPGLFSYLFFVLLFTYCCFSAPDSLLFPSVLFFHVRGYCFLVIPGSLRYLNKCCPFYGLLTGFLLLLTCSWLQLIDAKMYFNIYCHRLTKDWVEPFFFTASYTYNQISKLYINLCHAQ